MKPIRLLIIAAVAGFLSLSALAETPHDGYIIRFKDAASAASAGKLVAALPTLYGTEEPSLDALYEPEVLYKTDDERLVSLFEQAGLVEYSEPDYYVRLYGYDYNADAGFAGQWAHTATHMTDAWQYGVYGNEVTVAVIDSGVDPSHPDLAENLLPGYNYLLNSANPADMSDTVGHGTGVAGIICAAANGTGAVGAAHRAKVVPLKVADSTTFLSSDLARAVFDAIYTYGADVINMSFGYTNTSSVESTTIRGALEDAMSYGIIVVAAAGNIDKDLPAGAYSYPASYDGVISVASLAKLSTGDYAPASTSQHNDRVTVIAPGSRVYTTHPGGSYLNREGTSFSSPYVAAVAALAKSVDPDITPEHFTELLIRTADKTPLAGAERNDSYGYGIVNAGALIRALAAENSRGGFLSPIDRRTDGSITVRFCNLSDSTAEFSFFARSGMSTTRPASIRTVFRTLAAGEIAEADITSLNAGGTISCYLLDRFSFRPMTEKRVG